MKKRFNGFTLVELLVVISIISILSSIILVNLNNTRDKGVLASGRQFAAHNYHALGADAFGLWNFNIDPSVSEADFSGNGRNLRSSAGIGVNIPKSSNNPFDFGSSMVVVSGGNYLTTGDISTTFSPTFLPRSVTGSAWVNFTNLPSGPTTIMGIRADTSGNRFPVIVHVNSSGAVTCVSDLFSGIQKSLTYSAVSSGKWHHIACSVKSSSTVGIGNISLFLDGKLVASSQFDGVRDLPILEFTVAGASTGGGSFVGTPKFNGFIDEVSMYSQELASTDIQRIYASGLVSHGLAIVNRTEDN